MNHKKLVMNFIPQEKIEYYGYKKMCKYINWGLNLCTVLVLFFILVNVSFIAYAYWEWEYNIEIPIELKNEYERNKKAVAIMEEQRKRNTSLNMVDEILLIKPREIKLTDLEVNATEKMVIIKGFSQEATLFYQYLDGLRDKNIFNKAVLEKVATFEGNPKYKLFEIKCNIRGD